MVKTLWRMQWMCSLASWGESDGFSLPHLKGCQDHHHLLHPPRAPKCPTIIPSIPLPHISGSWTSICWNFCFRASISWTSSSSPNLQLLELRFLDLQLMDFHLMAKQERDWIRPNHNKSRNYIVVAHQSKLFQNEILSATFWILFQKL